MKGNDVFPSNYINAAALNGKTPTVTIERVQMEKVGDDNKPVVYFRGSERGLALNRTNFNSIVEYTGQDDTDNWTGHRIKLITATVEYQGKRVPAVRIERAASPAPAARPAARPAPPPPPQSFDEPADVNADDIPFAWLLPLVLPAALAALGAGVLA